VPKTPFPVDEEESGPSDQDDAGHDPRRRTPEYMEAVRPASEAEPREPAGIPRTRIGIPPVSVLPPAMAEREPDPPTPEPSAVTSALTPLDGRARPSRETVRVSTPVATERPETISGRPGQLVVSAVRIEGTAALERVLRGAPPPGDERGHPRGRNHRPPVPPAEVLATKHVVPARRDWRLVVLDQRMVPQAAGIRSLRHRLADRGDPRVILVTSAGRRECKTFCAANLALALAEVKRSRVLLVDANLHHPQLASMFGITDPPCFFQQLEAHRSDFLTPWRVVELTTYDLHVLALRPGDGSRVFDGPHLTSCLDSLRGVYEYIVVDGPPVANSSEIPLLEDAVDGLVFTARAGHAHAQSLRYALEQVSPQDVLGVVLVDL
jgi:Mrp family chromosome partitioning ATPase